MAFRFDPCAALARAQTQARSCPTIPTAPTGTTRGIEAVGTIGTVDDPITPVCDAHVALARTKGKSKKLGDEDLFDAFEERAAIRQHDGEQTRAVAEAAAMKEVARNSGLTPGQLQSDWADHPDARSYLEILARQGPLSIASGAAALGWTLARAWQAEARLRAAGLARVV